MAWLVLALVVTALLGAIWKIWRGLMIRPGQRVSMGGVERRVLFVNPFDQTITLDEHEGEA